MIKSVSEIAQEYYTAMVNKDISTVERYISQDVNFIGPLSKAKGKDTYLNICQAFLDHIESLQLNYVLGNNDRAVVVYDVYFPDPIGKTPGVAILDFEGGMIKQFHIFYDPKPFEEVAQTIFAAK